MEILAVILSRLIDAYILIVFVNVILSWVALSTQNTTIRRIYWMTGQFVDPVLQPLRKIMQPMSRNIGIDFSPMVLLFGLYILNQLLNM